VGGSYQKETLDLKSWCHRSQHQSPPAQRGTVHSSRFQQPFRVHLQERKIHMRKRLVQVTDNLGNEWLW